MTPNQDRTVQDRTLAYYRDRQCSQQWRDLLSVLVDELRGNAGAEETLAFFVHLGERLARRSPLPEVDTLEELETAINDIWRQNDWGWCHFQAENGVIIILHDAWPDLDDGEGSLWPSAFAAVLRGAYDTWLRGQGGERHVETTVLRDEPGAALELCYGC